MVNIRLVCVGKMREKFYIDAAAEYIKRLSPMAKIEITEISEEKLPESPSDANISAALKKEAARIEEALENANYKIALCIEGDMLESDALSDKLSEIQLRGMSRITFVIGGSNGLDERIKASADMRLSMSRMTFPHHLARVMILEQIYRAFMISSGGKYHK